MILIVGVLSVSCIFRLLQCHSQNPHTYGEIAQLALGRWGRYAVDVSLILSQVSSITVFALWLPTCYTLLLVQSGFCCAYTIFITQVCESFHRHHNISEFEVA